MNSASKYFYNLDHLGSIREITDNSSVVQAQYAFDPFGRVTKISEAVASDFGYTGYYLHPRSGLNLTRARAYNSSLGRFVSRDPIEEQSQINLYGYVSNRPTNLIDPSGLAPSDPTGGWATPGGPGVTDFVWLPPLLTPSHGFICAPPPPPPPRPPVPPRKPLPPIPLPPLPPVIIPPRTPDWTFIPTVTLLPTPVVDPDHLEGTFHFVDPEVQWRMRFLEFLNYWNQNGFGGDGTRLPVPAWPAPR